MLGMKARRVRTAAVAAAMLATLACSSGGSPPPSVVLITLDAVRGDQVSAQATSAGATPELDRFAARATVHAGTVSTSSSALPSHVSLLTGRLPSAHQVRLDPTGPVRLSSAVSLPSTLGHYRAWSLPPDSETLGHVLQRAGHATAAVVASPWLRRTFGWGGGFDLWDDSGIETIVGRPAASVTGRGPDLAP